MKENLKNIAMIILISMIIVMNIFIWQNYLEEKENVKIGKCFDKMGNEIIGEECLIKMKMADVIIMNIISLVLIMMLPLAFMRYEND